MERKQLKKTGEKRSTFTAFDAAAVAVGIFLFVYLNLCAKQSIGVPDEGFYLSLPARFWRGDLPLVHEWGVEQLFSFFLVIPYRLYLMIFGSTEGILLAFRRFFVCIDVLFYAYTYYKLRKEKAAGILCAFLFCSILPSMGPALNYYTISDMAFFQICLMLFLVPGEKSRRTYVIAGMIWAIGVLAEPLMILSYLLYCIAYFIVKRRRIADETCFFQKKAFRFISLGGWLVFAVFVISLGALGCWSGFRETARYIFNDAGYSPTDVIDLRRLLLLTTGAFGIVPIICYIFCLLGAVLYAVLSKRQQRTAPKEAVKSENDAQQTEQNPAEKSKTKTVQKTKPAQKGKTKTVQKAKPAQKGKTKTVQKTKPAQKDKTKDIQKNPAEKAQIRMLIFKYVLLLFSFLLLTGSYLFALLGTAKSDGLSFLYIVAVHELPVVLAAPIWYLLCDKKDERLLLLTLTSLLFTILVDISSDWQLGSGGKLALLPDMLLLRELCREWPKNELCFGEKRRSVRKYTVATTVCLAMGLFSIWNIGFLHAELVYPMEEKVLFGNPDSALSETVQKGPCKGLKTTKEIAAIYNAELEDLDRIRAQAKPDEPLLVFDLFPAAYLYLDLPCASSTTFFKEELHRIDAYWTMFPEKNPVWIYVPFYDASAAYAPYDEEETDEKLAFFDKRGQYTVTEGSAGYLIRRSDG